MTRKEALEILDRASSSVATNRQTHQQIINAVQIIYSAIEKLEELEKQNLIDNTPRSKI